MPMMPHHTVEPIPTISWMIGMYMVGDLVSAVHMHVTVHMHVAVHMIDFPLVLYTNARQI